jgi:hypothetical protein
MQSWEFSLVELWGTISMGLDLVKADAKQKPLPPERERGLILLKLKRLNYQLLRYFFIASAIILKILANLSSFVSSRVERKP